MSLIFSIGDQVTLGFFLLDIIVNLRTTYKDSNFQKPVPIFTKSSPHSLSLLLPPYKYN